MDSGACICAKHICIVDRKSWEMKLWFHIQQMRFSSNSPPSAQLSTTAFWLPGKLVFPHVRSLIRLRAEEHKLLIDFLSTDLSACVAVSLSSVHSVGTLCKVIAKAGPPNDPFAVVLEGVSRIRLMCENSTPTSLVGFCIIPDSAFSPESAEPLVTEIASKLNELVKLESSAHKQDFQIKFPSNSPHVIGHIVMSALLVRGRGGASVSPDDGQAVLECVELVPRLTLVSSALTRSIEGLKISIQVNETIQKRNSKEIRQILIRRQIAELQTQLAQLKPAEDEEALDELGLIKRKIGSLQLPEAVDKIVTKELKRIEAIQPTHPEYHGILSYLETAVSLPWGAGGAESVCLAEAEASLESSHFGLKKVKLRIIEYLAVLKLRQQEREKEKYDEKFHDSKTSPSSVLCLAGGPGLGKTSIAESIAKSLGRNFVRISLGGVRDESELRGHRKTYIGAMPGLVVQSLVRAGVNNPVILLDEIDKISGSGRKGPGGGSPESVLLEILDPAQNHSFRDAYLNFGIDLSRCLFVCTCNSLEGVSRPLLDRLEVIHVPSYTESEKVEIAKRHLVEKNLRSCGIQGKLDLRIPDSVLRCVVANYTAEAGVRELNRKLAQLCRHYALELVRGGVVGSPLDSPLTCVTISVTDLSRILGPPAAEGATIPAILPVGVALGLAVSSVGGEVLFIESVITARKGTGTVLITGQLGDVMKESVRAALSYLTSRPSAIGSSVEIDPLLVKTADIHVHFPTGAVPKDGPSAGVSTSIALASLFSGMRARSDLASTGEITLRGQVLPVGGVKEKVMAAHRAGIRTVLVPLGNRACLQDDLPADVSSQVEIIFVKTIDQVLALAFQDPALLRASL